MEEERENRWVKITGEGLSCYSTLALFSDDEKSATLRYPLITLLGALPV